jgi:hypothetical protein
MRQVTISIPDEAYATAEKRAQEEGFGSAEMFLSDLVVSSVDSDDDDYQHLFTPEVIAELDAIASKIDAGGKLYTEDEVRASLAANREAWLKNHGA